MPVSYLGIARAIKAATPRMHLHAYRPQDVWDLADRAGLGLDGALEALREAGVDTVPGTGVKVLSERVRALVAPGDLEIDRWVEGITAAHRHGFRSTSVLFYGHVETAAERVAHLRRLRAIQDQTGGFTEFVPIPLPGPSGGVPLVAGRPALDEHRAVVAVSRLLLSGSIPHVQIPWTRVGRDAAAILLQSGGDDLGGTLLDGRVLPEAGIEQGLELPLPDAARIAARLSPAVPPAHDRLPRTGRGPRPPARRLARRAGTGAPMTRVEVAVVGAGFAGLGMAIALRRAGREDFVVLERAASVGGTWRDNTYPGVACDVPSHLYGFADHPNPDWSGVFARGDEIRRYLEDVAEREGLGDRLHLNAPVMAAAWDAAASVWRIEIGGETPSTIEADVLVLACGRLTEPAIPEIPGLETFPGPLFHSSRWDHDADLVGARVALVGTGASAVQVLPELARTASHVTLFQRTPAWIVPRGGGEYTEDDRRRFAEHPAELARLRSELYSEGEARFASRSGDAAASAAARSVALDHLHAQVSAPALRSSLTPDYAFGCKRVLLSDEFYPAVSGDGVTLEASALATVDGRLLTSAEGVVHEVDALVLATGFASTRQPYAGLVRGEGGTTLAEHWSAGMTSFGSTVVSGFPNLFVLNGPNASLGHNSSVLMIEEQAAYAVRAMRARDSVADGVLRVAPAAEARYTAEIDEAAATTPWIAGGCRNWYVDERSGRLTLLWPGTVDGFRDRLARADGSEFQPAVALLGGRAGVPGRSLATDAAAPPPGRGAS